MEGKQSEEGNSRLRRNEGKGESNICRVRRLKKGLSAGICKQFGNTCNRLQKIKVHSFIHPVECNTKKAAFIKLDQKIFIFRRKREACGNGINVLGYNVKHDSF